MLWLLAERKGHIYGTFSGLVGDSGSVEPDGVMTISDEEIKRFLGSEEEYLRAKASRLCVKASLQLRFEPISTCMTTFYGVDNRHLLPPFFPYFRMEDAIFADVLRACDPEARFAFPTVLLEHLPMQKRGSGAVSSEDADEGPNLINIQQLLRFILSNLKLVGRGPAGLAKNLVQLGAAVETGCKDRAGVLDASIAEFLTKESRQIEIYQKRLEEMKSAPEFYLEDLRKCLAVKRKILAAPTFAGTHWLNSKERPLDPRELEDASFEMIENYSQLMQIWPDIIELSKGIDWSSFDNFS